MPNAKKRGTRAALPYARVKLHGEPTDRRTYFRGVSELEELEVELDGVLLVSELELVLPVVSVAEPLAEPVAEPLAEPLALMSELDDVELDGVVLDGADEEAGWVLISEVLRVDLLQPAKPKAKAARAAAPVSFSFCVFIFLPQGF